MITGERTPGRDLEKSRLPKIGVGPFNWNDRALERWQLSLQQFAMMVSHELRGPLGVIHRYLDLVSRRYGARFEEEAAEFIQLAIRGTQKMEKLLEALLSYASVGVDEMGPYVCDSESALESVLKEYEPAIEENRAEITFTKLPFVCVNPLQVEQIFRNLLSNALKFRASHVKLRIRISAAKTKDRWVFSVEDNGIGFEMEFAERIFNFFERLHSESHYPGNGMGLAICKKIVEQYGGAIWAESKKGVGSVFYFTLPGEHGVNSPVKISADSL